MNWNNIGGMPVYETMPGWQTPVTEARKFEDLPKQAQAYLQRIAELTGARALTDHVRNTSDETIRAVAAARP